MDVLPGRDAELLTEVAAELEATRTASALTDADLILRWVSSEMAAFLESEDQDELGYGRHIVEAMSLPAWRERTSDESFTELSRRVLPYAMAHAEQHENDMVEPLHRLAEPLGLTSHLPPPVWTGTFDYVEPDGSTTPSRYSCMLLGHPLLGFIGTALLIGSPLRARVFELLTRGDEAMYERIAELSTPRQEATAVLFADIESSAELSRRLSTPSYFGVMRRLLTAADDAIAKHAGIVGKHAGDGVTGFFRVADAGSPSAAARMAIETARHLQRAAEEESVRLNIGLHFAPAVFLGQLITSGRLEITALGDDVTTCGRLQESARGGEVLASKLLVEQLDAYDAKVLGLDPTSTTYTPLDNWPTVSEKARRDAPRLPVCAL